MFSLNESADPDVHETSIRTARRCRNIVQAVLREEEWGDADREFYLIIRDELQKFVTRSEHAQPSSRT